MLCWPPRLHASPLAKNLLGYTSRVARPCWRADGRTGTALVSRPAAAFASTHWLRPFASLALRRYAIELLRDRAFAHLLAPNLILTLRSATSRSCSSGRSAPCRSTSTPTPPIRPTTCSKYRHHFLVPGTLTCRRRRAVASPVLSPQDVTCTHASDASPFAPFPFLQPRPAQPDGPTRSPRARAKRAVYHPSPLGLLLDHRRRSPSSPLASHFTMPSASPRPALGWTEVTTLCNQMP